MVALTFPFRKIQTGELCRESFPVASDRLPIVAIGYISACDCCQFDENAEQD
jgi:hypothetical protein